MTLLTVKSALLLTLSTAVALVGLLPREVVSDVGGMVLVKLPATLLVTTLVIVQLPPGGMSDPTDKVTVPKLALALAAAPMQLVCATELELTRPTG
jgi:hypothetical protein